MFGGVLNSLTRKLGQTATKGEAGRLAGLVGGEGAIAKSAPKFMPKFSRSTGYLDIDKRLAEIVDMSPDDYLKKAFEATDGRLGGTYDSWLASNAVDPSVTKGYATAMKNGDEFPLVYIDNALGSQDGRNRALAVKMAGGEKMPVGIIPEMNDQQALKFYTDKLNNTSSNYSKMIYKKKVDELSKKVGESLPEEAMAYLGGNAGAGNDLLKYMNASNPEFVAKKNLGAKTMSKRYVKPEGKPVFEYTKKPRPDTGGIPAEVRDLPLTDVIPDNELKIKPNTGTVMFDGKPVKQFSTDAEAWDWVYSLEDNKAYQKMVEYNRTNEGAKPLSKSELEQSNKRVKELESKAKNYKSFNDFAKAHADDIIEADPAYLEWRKRGNEVITAWHGSKNKFDKFDDSRFTDVASGELTEGIFFAPEKVQAKLFGDNVYETRITGDKIEVMPDGIGYGGVREQTIRENPQRIFINKNADTGAYTGDEIIIGDNRNTFIVDRNKYNQVLKDIYEQSKRGRPTNEIRDSINGTRIHL